jgi:Icc-related predicted phosphoesterase
MRILAFTDIHGSYDKVNKLIQNEPDADAVIIGGDLTTYGSTADAENAIRLFGSNKKPVFVVAGNMDPVDLDQSFERLRVSVNAKGVVFKEVGIFGVSGSPFTPMHTPNEIAEEEIARRALEGWKDVAVARWKIFVPHAPPRDTRLDRVLLGKHVGSTAVRSFIELHQPDVVVCGHIHEARGVDTIGKTQIVNCGQAGKGYYAVINLDDKISVEVKG